MKVGIGCDHAAIDMKNAVRDHLKEEGYDVVDYGAQDPNVSVDYPVIAKAVGFDVADGKLDRGILICGTGIGMSLAANKIKGIRCAVLSDTYSARLTVEHNDSNMMSMGARVIGVELAKDVADAFLKTVCPHEEKHEKRLAMIRELEN